MEATTGHLVDIPITAGKGEADERAVDPEPATIVIEMAAGLIDTLTPSTCE